MPKPTKFIITETDEFLTSQGGLAMIGMLAQRCGLRDRISAVVERKKDGSISTADALLTMIGLLFCPSPTLTRWNSSGRTIIFSNVWDSRTFPPKRPCGSGWTRQGFLYEMRC